LHRALRYRNEKLWKWQMGHIMKSQRATPPGKSWAFFEDTLPVDSVNSFLILSSILFTPIFRIEWFPDSIRELDENIYQSTTAYWMSLKLNIWMRVLWKEKAQRSIGPVTWYLTPYKPRNYSSWWHNHVDIWGTFGSIRNLCTHRVIQHFRHVTKTKVLKQQSVARDAVWSNLVFNNSVKVKITHRMFDIRVF
jgi:hypothetical protein